jgi:hypothetical protein
VNPRFFDRFFLLIKTEEIVALYEALLNEKTILVVCESKHDVLPIVFTLLDLMQPFEWMLSIIPFLYSDEDYPNWELFEMINFPQAIIIGIHKSSFQFIQEKMIEDFNYCKQNNKESKMTDIIVLDLTYTYRDPKFQP